MWPLFGDKRSFLRMGGRGLSDPCVLFSRQISPSATCFGAFFFKIQTLIKKINKKRKHNLIGWHIIGTIKAVWACCRPGIKTSVSVCVPSMIPRMQLQACVCACFPHLERVFYRGWRIFFFRSCICWYLHDITIRYYVVKLYLTWCVIWFYPESFGVTALSFLLLRHFIQNSLEFSSCCAQKMLRKWI